MPLAVGTGRRWEILDAMRKAEQLRARPRKKAGAAGLPSRADLRSEATQALCTLDARVVQQAASPAGTSWALSPDGRLALSFTPENGTLVARLRDFADGSERPPWSVTPDFQATAAAGGAIALDLALTDGTVQLWSLDSGAELLRWPANTPSAAIVHLAFTPDGKGLAGCDTRQHYLWRLDLPDLRRRLADGLDW